MSATLSRRSFIATASAAAVAATVMPTALAGTPEISTSAAAAVPVGSWGFSLNDENYFTGYASAAEALAEAQSYADDEEMQAVIAFCVREELRPIDGADVAAEWLSGCCGRRSFGHAAVGQFIDAQDEVDFEGDLLDALAALPDADLIAMANRMLVTSLIRIGCPDIAARVASGEIPTLDEPLCDDDAIFKRLCADKGLTVSINEALMAWADVPSVDRVGRALQLSDAREIVIPALSTEGRAA